MMTALRIDHFLFQLRVETEDEVKAALALIQEKIAVMRNRGRGALAQSQQFYASAERAKSLLRPEVVRYINHAFTRKGMRDNVVGRKKRNYPKRSKIIR